MICRIDSVRAVQMTPDKPVFHVGEELRCSASGNPTPQLALSPAVAAGAREGQRGGKAWKVMVVPVEWKGKSHTVTCTAVNNLNGEHTQTASVTFNITSES